MNFECDLVDFTYNFGKSNLSQMMKLANGSVVALHWSCIFCYTGTGNINSSHPSAAYIPRWIGSTLVQIMACRLFGTNWTLGNRIRWNLNQNTNFFIHKNAFENVVCELAAIFRGGGGGGGGWSRDKMVTIFRRESHFLHWNFLPVVHFSLALIYTLLGLDKSRMGLERKYKKLRFTPYQE